MQCKQHMKIISMALTHYIYLYFIFPFQNFIIFQTNLIKFSCICVIIYFPFLPHTSCCRYCCRFYIECDRSLLFFRREFHICNSNISANKLLEFFMMGIKVLIQDLTCFFLSSAMPSTFSHFLFLAAYCVLSMCPQK